MVDGNFVLKQDSNQSEASVVDTFGVLDSLAQGNLSDAQFVSLWFSVKLAPLLPYIDKNFLSQLSSLNLSCSSFQKL